VTLGANDAALGEVWHVPNARAVSLRRFVELVFAAIGAPMRLQRVPQVVIALLAIFDPTLRALREQRYQTERPWIVDSTKFERVFGWGATPLERSIPETVEWFRSSAPSK
jgi:hypothetical protein